jgi:nucleoid-associated protein YgaU
MDAKAKIGLTIGGLLLAGMVAWVLMPGSKTRTDLAENAPPAPPAPTTEPAPTTAPAVDPFARPFSSTTMPVAAVPTATRPATPADAWNVLDNGPAGAAARTVVPVPVPVRTAADTATSVPRTYKVQHGDSLYTISEKVLGSPKYVDQIIKANPGLNPKSLKVGQEIKLPQVGSAAAPAAASAASSATPAPAPTATAGSKTYTIAAGDSLGKIAKKFYGHEDQWKKIYDANKSAIGPDPAKLKVGTTLQIPE